MMTSDRTVVFIFVFLADVTSGQRIVLWPVTDFVSRKLGRNAVFNCSVEQSPSNNFSLRWMDPNNNEITNETGRIYVQTVGDWKTVYITRIQESDAGSYICRSEIAGTWYELDMILFFIGT